MEPGIISLRQNLKRRQDRANSITQSYNDHSGFMTHSQHKQKLSRNVNQLSSNTRQLMDFVNKPNDRSKLEQLNEEAVRVNSLL